MTKATPYMEILNRETGLDAALSASGAAAFQLEGRGLLLQWQEVGQAFVVYVEIGPLAGWRDGEVCRQLLAANFLLVQTEGGALSYNEAANMVGLNYLIPVYGLAPEEFVGKLNAVINLADQWKNTLAELCAAQERAVAREQDAEALLTDDAAPDANLGGQFLRV